LILSMISVASWSAIRFLSCCSVPVLQLQDAAAPALSPADHRLTAMFPVPEQALLSIGTRRRRGNSVIRVVYRSGMVPEERMESRISSGGPGLRDFA
jgi:hypothetical protein